MSYIIKNSTQGAIVARLTDAGRKKLSEGKLNISLYQVGDSEVCYNCYSQSFTTYPSLNVLQAEHNAQNLTPIPEKNKGHVKYPLAGGVAGLGTSASFGPTIPQHEDQEVYNTATPRGFFKLPQYNAGFAPVNGGYQYYSAQTNSQYTLSSNWRMCGTGMTGTSLIHIFSADCSPQQYAPVNGDLISITWEFKNATYAGDCEILNYSAASQTLFYQVIAGNTSSTSSTPLNLTLDRKIPDYNSESLTGCARIRVYPGVANKPMLRSSIYSLSSTTSYWCDDTLSFNDCCSIATNDTKIWNMNINWTHTVAGITSGFENVNGYGSSGYCGTKEYFGYESNDGQAFSYQMTDSYHPSVIGGTWYFDSEDNTRVVLPEDQKCIGIIHYTNGTTTDFYGEKFALKEQGFGSSTIGEAKNFKLHLPWLMWHKKNQNGSGTGTGLGDETVYGQTFYVDPPLNSMFNSTPNVMMSSKNSNMNDDGLRYWFLTDDNVGTGSTVATPNVVGKVFPDYKMVVIDDQELLAAMSYKSNRSYTIPAPSTSKLAAGTACAPTGCTAGVISTPGDKIYMTYMLADNTAGLNGLHCNYYVSEEYNGTENLFDVALKFGPEFPYLGDLSANGGVGFESDKLFIIWQIVPNGGLLLPGAWNFKDATQDIKNHTVGTAITAAKLVDSTFYLTGNDTDAGCTNFNTLSGYTLNDYIDMPVTNDTTNLQFGDEYFLYGTLETDIMATIYEMRHIVQLGSGDFNDSVNPTFVEYNNDNPSQPAKPQITEIGLYDNENGFPDLMVIAKLQSPVERVGPQQFVISIDF